MSPTHTNDPPAARRFPRVSGDEPKIRTTDGAWGWFSRRERG